MVAFGEKKVTKKETIEIHQSSISSFDMCPFLGSSVVPQFVTWPALLSHQGLAPDPVVSHGCLAAVP